MRRVSEVVEIVGAGCVEDFFLKVSEGFDLLSTPGGDRKADVVGIHFCFDDYYCRIIMEVIRITHDHDCFFVCKGLVTITGKIG